MDRSQTSATSSATPAAGPEVRFLSLFVPDLQAAARAYEEVFGVVPSRRTDALARHPYAAAGPVVFDLGGVQVALYQCDQRITHPGDVGIGVVARESAQEIAQRVDSVGGRVFFGPEALPEDPRKLAVFVMPDRHFFEVVDRSSR